MAMVMDMAMNMAKPWPCHSRATAKIWPNHGQDNGQATAKPWQALGRANVYALAEPWLVHDQATI